MGSVATKKEVRQIKIDRQVNRKGNSESIVIKDEPSFKSVQPLVTAN